MEHAYIYIVLKCPNLVYVGNSWAEVFRNEKGPIDDTLGIGLKQISS